MEARTQSPTLEESNIVERVARIVSSVRGAKSDYAHLASELEPAIPFDIFGIALLRHDGQAVRVTVCKRKGNGWFADHHQHPFSDSMVERILNRRQDSEASGEDATEILVKNYPTGLDGSPAESGDALSGNPHLRATLVAPLVVADRILGTLELGSTHLNAYADETLLRLISAVVRVLAAAIESAQVGGSVEIQDRQRQELKRVSSAITSDMDLSMILDRIVVGIAKALNVASAIVTFDQRGGGLHLEAQSGLDDAVLERVIGREVASSEQCILGLTLRRHQPCVTQDIATDERFPLSSGFASELAVRSIFSHPLLTGSTVYGALLLCSPEPGGFTPLKADILSLFAGQATIAIHNGMLLEATHERRRFQEETALLAQTVEASLARAGLLGDVGAALGVLDPNRTQAKESLFSQINEPIIRHIVDPLFVIDLHGRCIYVTPAAEVFCGMRLDRRTSPFVDSTLGVLHLASSISLQEAFAVLLPRIRNVNEVLSYLQAFTLENLDEDDDLMAKGGGEDRQNVHLLPDAWSTNSLRCIIAAEPIRKKPPLHLYASDDHIPPADSQLLLDEAGNLERISQRVLHSAPSDRHYQLKRHPLYDSDGQLIANALQVQDITEQVRDEKNRSALLSVVSHDLRTPLTTIKAAVTGLMQTGVEWDEKMLREILEEIDAETDHLDTLVNSLIEMSRIQMGALVLEKEWCDVVELVYSTLSRMERMLDRRPVRTEFQPQLPLIQADYVQLGRVFHNLIENAVRYSPAGTEILVTLNIVSQQGLIDAAPENSRRFLRAQVIDHGMGVPEGERERIFRPFYSLDSKSSGLGLAICQGIVEAHQGRIWVEPASHGGSRFVFVLPNIS